MPAQISESLDSDIQNADLIVVGAGFYGATIAERAAAEGFRVVILDRRGHIGGNAYSEIDSFSGVEVHKYGSHLFHTSNQRVWDYVKKFTAFNDYRHTVWTTHKGISYPMPINLATISQFYGRSLSPADAASLIESERGRSSAKPQNLEEKAISLVGRPLYEAFIRGYTKKQWETNPRDLPPEIISRLPVRYNYNNRYFEDRWEGLPVVGYTKWVETMVAHQLISIHLNIDYNRSVRHSTLRIPVVYTGPIDEYFSYSEGMLGWRTLDFETRRLDQDDFLGTAVMNFADDEVPFTRIHEFKHLHPERETLRGKTVVMYEYSRFAQKSDEPYYPINSASDRAIIRKYRERIRGEKGVFFGGRLGSYQYLDMHMAIASALVSWESEVFPYLTRQSATRDSS